jgi:hypothetical protein
MSRHDYFAIELTSLDNKSCPYIPTSLGGVSKSNQMNNTINFDNTLFMEPFLRE